MKVARALRTKFITHGSVQMKRAVTVDIGSMLLHQQKVTISRLIIVFDQCTSKVRAITFIHGANAPIHVQLPVLKKSNHCGSFRSLTFINGQPQSKMS